MFPSKRAGTSIRSISLVLFLAVIAVSIRPGLAVAQEDTGDTCVVCMVVGLEVLGALVSYSAAKDPEDIGESMGLVSMAFGAAPGHRGRRELPDPELEFGQTKTSLAPFYTLVGTLAAFGLYNYYELSKDEYSEEERFWHNEIGGHIVVLSTIAVHYLTKEEEPEDRVLRHGIAFSENMTPMFVMQYRF